jgi:Do/DeqQ family serine protease
MPSRGRRVLVILVVAMLSGAAGFVLSPLAGRRAAPRGAPAVPLADGLQAAFVGVAERVRPAVVNIGTVQTARPGRGPSPGPLTDDPAFKDFFERFFGPGRPNMPRGEFRLPSLGSGVIVDTRGDVLTNLHVVKGADGVTVRVGSGREYRGQIVGTDVKTDLALVRFEPDGDLAVAALGDSDRLRVGEWAIAIGNPFGLDQTVTVGVISATGRADVGIATYENFIQTDASINPGNSGGPLVNLRGEVIGINTAIVATGQGIGFAIPVNMVKRVIAQLLAQGKVTRGWLGVSVQPLTEDLAHSLGVSGAAGAIVARVYPGSPAAAAGLAQSDVIVAYDGTAVTDYHHLQRLVAETDVGKRIAVDIIRRRSKQRMQLRVAEAPETGAASR